MTTEDKTFSDYFAEAITDDPSKAKEITPVTQEPSTELEVEPTLEPATTTEPDTTPTAYVPVTTGESTQDAANVNTEVGSKVAELEDELRKEKQKTSSWDGRIRAANEKARKAEEELAKLQAEKGTSKEFAIDPNATNETVLKEFIDEFPDLRKPIELLAQRIATELIEAKTQKYDVFMEQAQETKEQTALDTHWLKINNAHADASTVLNSDHFAKWISVQSPIVKDALERVYNEGTASEIVEMLSQYKAAHKPATTTNTNTVQSTKIQDLEAVPSRSSGYKPSDSTVDKNDLDAAWKEAIRT